MFTEYYSYKEYSQSITIVKSVHKDIIPVNMFNILFDLSEIIFPK